MTTIKFEMKFDSGESNFEGLNLYYGADALGGMAEAISITTHAIINNEVIKQTPSTRGFSLNFKQAFEGSYRQKFELTFTDVEALRVVKYLKVGGFIELLSFHLGSPLGVPVKIESDSARRWARTYMTEGEELIERLARPLDRIHHPIYGQGYQAYLLKSRTNIIGFNQRTYDFLSGAETSANREFIEVAVSRFNTRTGTGRFIEDENSESISFTPFRKFSLSRIQKNALANSLKDLANDRITKLRAEVTRVNARDGRTKYYRLHSIYEI